MKELKKTVYKTRRAHIVEECTLGWWLSVDTEIPIPRVEYCLVRRGGRVYLYSPHGTRLTSTSKFIDEVFDYAKHRGGRRVSRNRLVLTEDAAYKTLIFMRVRPLIPHSKTVKLKKVIAQLGLVELMFWACKMLEEPKRAPRAFIELYGI